jgi:hypothetical protein
VITHRGQFTGALAGSQKPGKARLGKELAGAGRVPLPVPLLE